MAGRRKHFDTSNMSSDEAFGIINGLPSDTDSEGDIDSDDSYASDAPLSKLVTAEDELELDVDSDESYDSDGPLSKLVTDQEELELDDNETEIVDHSEALEPELPSHSCNNPPINEPQPPSGPSNLRKRGRSPELPTEEDEPVPPCAISSISRSTYRRSKRVQSPELATEEDGPDVPTTGAFTGDITGITNDSPELKSIIWRKKNLQVHVNEVVFRGEKQLPANLKELNTPYDCIRYFLNDDFFRQLSEQTNLYARQKNISTKFTTDATELRQFIGILIFMSVYRYPNVRSYWARHSFEGIRQTMPVLRFEQIRRHLHFNDNSTMIGKDRPEYDKLHKVRPLITHFNNVFLSVPMLSRLCVDEQMCATKMTRSSLRQYLPNKPHKWGFKLFPLCDSKGFSYAFEIYAGAGDNIVPPNAPNLGASSNVVVRLSQHIPNFLNHILYFDNFYTSLGLVVYLRSRGIYSLGTVRTNRVPNCKLSSDAEIAKKKS